MEKIETIGDAFIVVVFEGACDPVLHFAMGVQQAMREWNRDKLDYSSTPVQHLRAVVDQQLPLCAEAEVAEPMTLPLPGSSGEEAVGSGDGEEMGGGAGSGMGGGAGSGRTPGLSVSIPGSRPTMSPAPSCRSPTHPPFQLHLRMGVSMGPAIGGIVGREVPRFALFGTALEEAVAMEQAGRRGEVVVGRRVYEDGKDRWEMEMGEALVGDMETYKLVGRRREGNGELQGGKCGGEQGSHRR